MKRKALACFIVTILGVSFTSAQQSPSLMNSIRSAGNNVDWAQFNFDSGHDGYNPYETILSPANVGNVTLKWSYAPAEGPVQGQPAIVNGVVYFVAGYSDASRGAVYALNADTGAFLWKFLPGGAVIGSSGGS